MPSGIKRGDTVYLPVSRVAGESENGPAIRKYSVEETKPGGRSLRVSLTTGSSSKWIATSAAHTVAGVFIIQIGDMATEATLLEPLYKSILQYCRLLLPDDSVRGIQVRSYCELGAFWGKEGAAYSHVVLVGHGREDGIQFGVGGWQTADTLGDLFGISGSAPKTFLLLCCETGKKAFARPFSQAHPCGCLIAPYHSVHPAVASQVCQTFLAHHILEGKSPKIAYERMRQQIPGSTIFRMWRQGRLLPRRGS